MLHSSIFSGPAYGLHVADRNKIVKEHWEQHMILLIIVFLIEGSVFTSGYGNKQKNGLR